MNTSDLDKNAGLDGWIGTGMVLGLVSGVIFLAFEMVVAVFMGASPLDPPLTMSTILLGPDALEAVSPVVPPLLASAGAALHFLLSALYGGAFGMIAGLIRPVAASRWALVGAATTFGLLLWIVNFYVISPVAFPWFLTADPVVQFVAHTFFFGTVLGLLLASRAGQTREVGGP